MKKQTAVQHGNAAQDRIVAAARQLFASRGFHQTAMADLAKAAQVSVGAIYRSYASKADIILAIIVADSEEMLGDLQGDVDRVREGQIAIDAAIERIVLRRLSDKDDGLTHEILAEAHRNPKVAEAISVFCAQYRDLFAELAKLARPSAPEEEIEGAAELLLACLFGIGHRELSKPRLDEATTARVATSLIMKALNR
ncbi:MAG: helix-turn-helix domain-containing protein [Sphingobium sp.]